MAFNQILADRISTYLSNRNIPFIEKKMFGGLAFMIEDKMTVGVIEDKLMAKIGPIAKQKIIQRKDAHPMDFTGRTMKNFVFVYSTDLDADQSLWYWIELALKFLDQSLNK